MESWDDFYTREWWHKYPGAPPPQEKVYAGMLERWAWLQDKEEPQALCFARNHFVSLFGRPLPEVGKVKKQTPRDDRPEEKPARPIVKPVSELTPSFAELGIK